MTTCTRCHQNAAALIPVAVLACSPAAGDGKATKMARLALGGKLCPRCAASVQLHDVMSMSEEADLRTLLRQFRGLTIVHKVLGWKPIEEGA